MDRNGIAQGLGGRLLAARERRGWSQEDLSDRTDSAGQRVSRNAISRIERGEMSPTAGILLAICSALDLNPAWVLTEKGSPDWAPDRDRREMQKFVARAMRRLADHLDEGANRGEDWLQPLSMSEMPERKNPNGVRRGLGNPKRKDASG